MSATSPTTGQYGQYGQPAPRAVPAWYDGLRVTEGEIGSALRLVVVLTAAGLPAGLLWLALAPRRAYEVVEGGFRAVEPQSEALIGADGWLLIVSGVLGVLAAGLVWRYTRVRGVGIVLGLAAGTVLATVVAWQVGEWLGSGPSEAQMAEFGAIVTPALQLRAIPVLVIGAFLATLSYLVIVCFASRDDLCRSRSEQLSSDSMERPAEPRAPAPREGWQAPSAPGATGVPAQPVAPLSGPPPAAPGDPRA